MDSFRGEIGHIIYTAPAEAGNFYIFTLQESKRNPGSRLSVKGNSVFSLEPGMDVTIRGEEGEYRGEPQIKASYIGPYVEITNKGAKGWLRTLPVSGFGDGSYKKLVERYPDNLSEKLSDVEAIRAAGIREAVAQDLADAWAILSMPNEVLELFSVEGLSVAMVSRIVETYGSRLTTILENDPWNLAIRVRGVGFKIADSIAQKLKVDLGSDKRLEALIYHVLSAEITNDGHTMIPMDRLYSIARSLGFRERSEIERVAEKMIKVGDMITRDPLSSMIGTTRMIETERSLAAQILRLMSQTDHDTVSESVYLSRIHKAEESLGIELDPSQRDAALCALKHRLSIITGGPGTGKSTTQAVILNALKQEREEKVGCTGPTGRAAQRLSEATGHEATTIHRALGYNPEEGGFKHCEYEPFEFTSLISDEYSMVDVELSDSFMRAISTGGRLIIVGDDEQLPSVGQGQVLRDMIRSSVVPVSRLSVVHRQAQKSGIITGAHAIAKGEVPEFNDHDLLFIEASAVETVQDVVINLLQKRLPEMGFTDANNIMILTPQRKGELGATRLNEIIKGVVNPAQQKNPEHTVNIKGVLWSVGDRVMHIKNNYEKSVFNGEMGNVTRTAMDEKTGAPKIFVTYPDKSEEVPYDHSDIKELDFSWASTIHKVQGSEALAGVMLVHSMHNFMLERCLVFTGETRAKKKFFFVGEKMALKTAVEKRKAALRETGLASYLRKAKNIEPYILPKLEEAGVSSPGAAPARRTFLKSRGRSGGMRLPSPR